VWSQDGPVSPERSSVVPRAGSSLNTSVIGKDDSPKPTAKLAEFIPLAVELSGRLVSLEHRLRSGLDVAAEKKRWAHWQTCIVAVGTLPQSDKTFARVQASVDRILHIIHEQLESQLAVQEKAGLSQTTLYTLTAECNRLLEQERHSNLLDASPPLLSKRLVSQFVSHELWYAAQTAAGSR
jgi:hypothetical protein